MLLQKTNKLAMAATLVLCLNANSVSAAASDQAVITELLTSLTSGNDGFYNKILAPAKSLNLNLSDSARTLETNKKMAYEIGTVLQSFKTATEDKKLATVKNVVQRIDSEINKNGGANIQVINGSPSAAFSRTLIMIEKKTGNTKASAEQLFKTFSSYKRSATPGTYFYEYSDARNISQSTIKTTTGSDTSWKPPLAAAEIGTNKELVLKKCRQIFGWKCVTAFYKTGQYLSDVADTKYLYASIYNLVDNPDHPEFAKDKRSVNQITGSTALYTITESSKWVLIYGIDAQWNEGSIMFASLIQEEFQKDFKRIKERIILDLKISQDDLK